MASLETSQLIGGTYQLLKLIGTGGMGDVYQAQNIHTNQLVAVKHLKPDVIDATPDVVERFNREGQALRELNHPNIVKMLAAVEENNQHYLVMEYISGGSLAELLARQTHLPVNQVLKIGLEVADALTRTHHLKIIHRDLKPANVLLAQDGTVRLTDFGIAHVDAAKPVTEGGLLIGTPDYLSPESLNGAETSTTTDIWAFGVMLFEMLAGKRPFTGATLTQLITAILTNPLPDLEKLCPDAPTALVDLIYQMLDKDANQRINSVRMIGAELEAISRGVSTTYFHHTVRLREQSSVFSQSTPHKRVLHNLPAQTTPFIGRETEQLELSTLLASSNIRLITILAPGGMGKTRLAVETGKTQLELFSDGVFFISLAPLNTPEAIVRAISDAARYSFAGSADPKQQLLQVLSNKQMLLILDNFEHLLSGAALIGEILEAAPAVKVIATSRSKLNLHGETLFQLEGMATPASAKSKSDDIYNYSAVKLFMQSAQRSNPNFTLSADDLPFLVRICRQVEGLPLGLVLAAAWADTLSLAEISDEIAKSLDFLEAEQQNVPTRQHSIQAVFDYSWNLLTDDERMVLMKLSVFQGDFTRDAAEKVAGAALKTLAALVNKSMLRRNASNGRYNIHELLRQYAARKLEVAALTDETRKTHSTYYADFMDERLLDLQGRRQIAALREMDAEFNNLRVAWLYILNHHVLHRISNFATALWMYFDLRSRHEEGRRLFSNAVQVLRTLPSSTDADFLIGYFLGIEAYHNAGIGIIEQSEPKAKEAIAILEQHSTVEALTALTITWCGLSLGYGVIGDANFASTAEKFADLSIASGKQWLITRGYLWRGLARWLTAAPNEAKQDFQKCLQLAQEIGDVYFVAAAYLRLGNVAHSIRNYSEAKQYGAQALPYFEKVGQPWSINQTENLLGDAAFQMKDYINAQKHFRLALKSYREYATINELMFFILRNVEVMAAQAPDIIAVQLLSFIVNCPQNVNNPHHILDEAEKIRAILTDTLPSQAYDEAWEYGKTLGLDTIVDSLLVNE